MMRSEDERPEQAARRTLLVSMLGAGTLAALGPWREVLAAAASASQRPPRRALSEAEFADVDAICAQIIPTDAEPGAREAGVPYFVDGALASFFAARAASFRAGLADFQSRARAAQPTLGAFAAWPVERQLEFLATVDRSPFFALLRDLTVLGLLSMPAYGGNRGGSGWKLIGFADQHAFTPPFGHYDRDYAGFVPYAKERP
jgi:gluconate 2-dehydrogenase gamma chain